MKRKHVPQRPSVSGRPAASLGMCVALALLLVCAPVHANIALAQDPGPKVWDFYWTEVLGGTIGAGLGWVVGVVVAEQGLCDGDPINCGLLFGNTLGATLGVSLAGGMNGVNGTWWLAPIGAVLGSLTGVWLDLIFQLATEGGYSLMLFSHAFAALLAALGYNIGASMQ